MRSQWERCQSGVAVTSDGRYLFVTGNGPNSLFIVDTQTRAVVNTIVGAGSVLGDFIARDSEEAITQAIEFYNEERDHYFLTADVAEAADLDAGVHAGWKRTGLSIALYAPGGSLGKGVPVCRFYGLPSAGLDSHFYSAGTSECEAVSRPPLSLAWLKESENVLEAAMPQDPEGRCPPPNIPVFRLWNNRKDSNHRYTTSEAVRQEMLGRGFVSEGLGANGVVWCAVGSD